jgi:cytochrome c oxidase subunit 4
MSMEHVVPIRTYLAIFVALLVGTALTTGAAFVDLGPLNVVVMLLIAFAKATLVVLFFMHVKFTNRLTQIAAASGFAWLVIMIALTLSDYLTRQPVPWP